MVSAVRVLDSPGSNVDLDKVMLLSFEGPRLLVPNQHRRSLRAFELVRTLKTP
jgi:hypothetical protein